MPHAVRDFFRVFWRDSGKDSVSNATQLPLEDWKEGGFLEMAQLKPDVFYVTWFEEAGGEFQIFSYDANTGASNEAVVSGWDNKVQICNPTFFRMRLSGQPMLLFSARLKNSNHYDLFCAELTNNGFARPSRLSEAVNSPYDETHPFVALDGTLYFSSNRPPDEIEDGPSTKRNKAPTDLWQAPTEELNSLWKDAAATPLPPLLSSPASEYALMPVRSGLRGGFFVSDREDGRLNLYRYRYICPDATPQAQPHALIIAVDDYQSLGKLDYPLREARTLDSVLTYLYCFKVERLENPTAQQILDKLSKYSHLQKNHHLLIAYMGHGLLQLNGQDSICLLTGVDSRAEVLSTLINPDDFHEVLPQQTINSPQHILLLLDACWGGLFRARETRSATEFDNYSRSVIASTLGKPVLDGGPFNKCLIQILRKGREDKTDLLESSLYFLINECMKGSQNKPSYFHLPGSKGGEFRFERCKW